MFKLGYKIYCRIGFSRVRSLWLQIMDAPFVVKYFG